MVWSLVSGNSIAAVLRTLWGLSKIVDTSLLFSSFSGVALLFFSHIKVLDLELLGLFHIEAESKASELRLTCSSRALRRLLILRHTQSAYFE